MFLIERNCCVWYIQIKEYPGGRTIKRSYHWFLLFKISSRYKKKCNCINRAMPQIIEPRIIWDETELRWPSQVHIVRLCSCCSSPQGESAMGDCSLLRHAFRLWRSSELMRRTTLQRSPGHRQYSARTTIEGRVAWRRTSRTAHSPRGRLSPNDGSNDVLQPYALPDSGWKINETINHST